VLLLLMLLMLIIVAVVAVVVRWESRRTHGCGGGAGPSADIEPRVAEAIGVAVLQVGLRRLLAVVAVVQHVRRAVARP